MKFACDKCNTRYSIADERVRGRVLKIRCKACNHVITVREEQPEPAADAFEPGRDEHTMVSTAPPAPREDAADEWFVSFDGDQEGPLPLLRAIDRVRSERPSGRECYCWRTGFFVWLPIEDVPEFAPALMLPKPAPPPPVPMDARGAPAAGRSPSGSSPAVARTTGSHAAVGKTTGSNPAVARSTGSNLAASRSPSGSNPAVSRSPSGSNPAVGRSPSGSNPVIGKSTGSNPALRTTGSQAAKATGSQASVARATGSHSTVSKTGSNPAHSGGSQATGKGAAPLPAAPTSNAHHGQMAEPAFELPGFDSGPLGTPNLAMPSLPTRPEPRVARRDEAHAAAPQPSTDSGPVVSPFAAALQAGGATQVSDAPSDRLNVPRPEQRLDTGPVPLPPPPGEDLPIGEASGLISLAHISKSAMPKPTTPGKSIETFGGVPVAASGHSPLPSAILAAPGAAPRSSPGWMKWAAVAGALATIGLGVVVVVLLTRKPLVIVVPPAPQLDDNKKVDNQPITVADPGPNPNPTAPPVAESDSGNKHSNKHARAAKPQTKSAGGDDKLSGEQGKLAALYRDDGEHAVSSQGMHAADRGGGNVSQQNIMAVATQNRRSLNLCYDRVLKHDSSLKSGRVLVHVKIGISGSVTGVNVPDPQYANAEIGQCLVQTIRRWHFPSADSEYETEFPIILQAN